ncbi:hypothetical protein RsTz2092_00350 [Deferribacterales bacterium RsTz2092]
MSESIEFLSTSKKMSRLVAQLEQVAQTDVSVLITGERGTGKNACARLLHEKSSRANDEAGFVIVVAANISEDGFRDALALQRSGTLYVDEVAELLPENQNLLLGHLSGSGGIPFRLIASHTGRAEHLARDKRFASELYNLLSVSKIRLIPLRERKDDVPLLISAFMNKYNTESSANKKLSDEAMRMLLECSWPGNIYELESAVQYAFQRSRTALIMPQSLPLWVSVPSYQSKSGENLSEELFRIASEFMSVAEQVKTFNVYDSYKELVFPPLLRAAMSITNGNISRAATLLGITRNTFKKLVKGVKGEVGQAR